MKLVYAILAEYGCVDEIGRATIAGVIREYFVRVLPAPFIQPFLCIEIEHEPHEMGRPIRMRMRLEDPDGRALLDLSPTPVPRGEPESGEYPRIASSLRLTAPVEIRQYGPHIMRFWLDGVEQPPTAAFQVRRVAELDIEPEEPR